uniref:Uncharacterized protein n=1 Tax=Homalodisca liturata TaxID=320908 RepID=A0A1B6HSR5_9HEMI
MTISAIVFTRVAMRGCGVFAILMCTWFISVRIQCFTIDHAMKLSERLNVMLRYPKYEYLPKLRKSLNIYTGVLSYITLKLQQTQGPIDIAVKEFYQLGPPMFMKVPIENKQVAFQKIYKWTDSDLELILDELKDAKKVWLEFSRQIKSKIECSKLHIANEK